MRSKQAQLAPARIQNAVQHGLQSSQKAGRRRLVVLRRMGEWLEMSISDDGRGVPATEVERVLFSDASARPCAVPVA